MDWTLGLAPPSLTALVPWPGSAGVAAAALLLGLLGRRRLPAGTGEGLLVAGVTGLLLANDLPGRAGRPLHLAALLTALTVLWHLVRRWGERFLTPSGSGAGRTPALRRNLVAGQAALVCGLLVASQALMLDWQAPRLDRLGVNLCLLLLVALSLRLAFQTREPLCWYAILALLLCGLRLGLLAFLAETHARPLQRALAGTGWFLLLAALGPVFQHWIYRRRAWRDDLDRLLDPPASLQFFWSILTTLAALVGLAALFTPPAGWTPVGVLLAALAAFIAGHRRGGGLSGEVGLALLGEGVVLIARSWLPDFGWNTLFGLTLASGYWLWLARFWHQQLHDGRAWTTAGALIPAARRLGYAGGLACFALASASWGRSVGVSGVFPAVVTSLALLLLGSLLIRDARSQGATVGVLAGGLSLGAAGLPWWPFLKTWGWVHLWPGWAGVAGGLLAWRLGPALEDRPDEWVSNALLGAWLPVTMWYAAFVPGLCDDYRWPLLAAVTLVAWLPAVWWRWRRRPAFPSHADALP